MDSIQDDLDAQVRFQVAEADALATQIADLNRQVVAAEAGRTGSAAALRDQRDDLLKQLSELVNITSREVEGGAVNVFIGNDPLLQYADSRGLTYVEEMDANGNKLSQVVFTDNEQPIDLTSGKIHGLITARDDQVGAVMSDLNDWIGALVLEVNKIHSLGQGLDGLTSVVSGFRVEDPTASLADMDATDLPWQINNGVFNLQVTDSSGNTVTNQIKVQIGIDSTDTTLNDLAAALDAIDNITAGVDGANRLQIQADSGFTFGFTSPDDIANATNALAALGINTFFAGSKGSDVQVRSELTADPRRLVASANGLAGNGEVAGRIAQLATSNVSSLNNVSLAEHFTSMVGRIAADSRAAQDNYIAADVVVQTLEAERQSISGVSTDEEAINMIIFQRAFQGAARYVSLIDEMLDEVIGLIR
jgi:flagellar hook-associated protein 1 FlgK